MSLALHGAKREKAEKFYNELLDILLTKNMPFMVGGTFAFCEYTGIERATGDIDIMTTQEDYPQILKLLSKNGYQTELAEIELKWLAKVKKDDFYTDIIFAERNGLEKISDDWLSRARIGTVLNHQVKLEPVEEMIRSKLYVQNRDRNDLGDVVHLLLRQGKTLNWQILWQKTEPHWELLAAAIFLFLFVYPSERNNIPSWIIENLEAKIKERFSHPPTTDKITRGLLLSNDYQVGVSRFGFQPVTSRK